MDPTPFTLRKLVWMAEAKRADAWKHTSALMALIVNVNLPKNSRPFEPEAFDPTLTTDTDRHRKKDYLPVSAAEFGRIIFGKQSHG